MPSEREQRPFVGTVGTDQVNLRWTAAVGNEGDLSPRLRVPTGRDVYRIARTREPAGARSVSIRDIEIHRIAVLARSENETPVRRYGRRCGCAFKLSGTDDQTILTANHNVRIAAPI